MSTTELPKRKFGIEIETISSYTQHHLSREIERIGLPVDTESHSYHSHNPEKWGVEHDGSIATENNSSTCNGCENYDSDDCLGNECESRGTYRYACEIISPPLSGAEGLEQVQKVLGILSKHCKVNKSCGVHVHVSAEGLTWGRVYNVFQYYSRFEELIDNFMPPSRRGNVNEFCRSINKIYGATRLRSKRAFKAAYRERYFKVNPNRYYLHNILEFRHHSGTIDYQKIVNWLKFLLCFVEYGNSYRRRIDDILSGEKALYVLLSDICRLRYSSPDDTTLAGHEIVKYFIARLDEFLPNWKSTIFVPPLFKDNIYAFNSRGSEEGVA